MNIVDYIIIAILGISIIMGMYRGFISGVLSLISLLGALFIAYLTYPQLAEVLQNNEALIRTLVHYTDAGSRIKDIDLAMTPITGISQDTLGEILSRANLPEIFQQFVQSNISGQVFSAAGSANTVSYTHLTLPTT